MSNDTNLRAVPRDQHADDADETDDLRTFELFDRQRADETVRIPQIRPRQAHPAYASAPRPLTVRHVHTYEHVVTLSPWLRFLLALACLSLTTVGCLATAWFILW